MHKIREAMKSSENHPIDGIVHVDEFVVGGKENYSGNRSIAKIFECARRERVKR